MSDAITNGNIKGEDTDVVGIDVTPEPAKPDTSAYDSIIEQQNAQIEALMKQNESLSSQVTKLIETGAQIRDASAGAAPEPEPERGENYQRPSIEQLDDKDDYSIDYLGNFIGGKHA